MTEADDDASVGVLKKLDGQVPTRFYWQLTLLATLGGFLFGYDTANIGSALRFVPETKGMSVEEITELFEAQAADGGGTVGRSVRPRSQPASSGAR